MSLAILERVMHLVRLAGSENEHEARNAAMQACKLIREHGLTLSSQVPVSSRPAPTPASGGPRSDCDECAGEGFYYFAGQRRPCTCVLQRERGPFAESPKSAPARATAPGRPFGTVRDPQKTANAAAEILKKAGISPDRPFRPAAVGGPKRTVAGSPKGPGPIAANEYLGPPVKIAAKSPGTCLDCRKAYAQGAAIWFRRGVGCIHEFCNPHALTHS